MGNNRSPVSNNPHKTSRQRQTVANRLIRWWGGASSNDSVIRKLSRLGFMVMTGILHTLTRVIKKCNKISIIGIRWESNHQSHLEMILCLWLCLLSPAQNFIRLIYRTRSSESPGGSEAPKDCSSCCTIMFLVALDWIFHLTLNCELKQQPHAIRS